MPPEPIQYDSTGMGLIFTGNLRKVSNFYCEEFQYLKKRSSTQKCLICLITKLLTNILQALRFFFPGQNKNLDKLSNFTVQINQSYIFTNFYCRSIHCNTMQNFTSNLYRKSKNWNTMSNFTAKINHIYIYILIFTAKVTIEIIQIPQ